MIDIRSETNWRWVLLGLVSLIFLVSTGGAFSTLGVLLPAMVEDLGWSWTQAGSGFTVLALTTGLSSTLPAYTISRLGIRLTYLTGGITIGLGFAGLALTNGVAVYLAAAALVGVGYTQIGAVAAVKLLSGWFVGRRSFAIGVFFTGGALGSVLGPIVASSYLTFLGSWRACWALLTILILCLCAAAALLVRERQDSLDTDENETGDQSDTEPGRDWTLAEALRTPQYSVIILALTMTLLGALTMNSWQVTHMQNLGVSAQIAAGALSAHALFNALSRGLGGIFIDRIGAKWMLASGLAAGVVGMAALAYAKNPVLIALYAFGDGYSFGIVTFATTILLLEYYGVKNNPAILGFLNLVSTIAMVGPIVAGRIGDVTAGFSVVFNGIAVLMMIPLALVVFMPKPVAVGSKPSR
ncbi:MAG: MFS transporter [Pseudomonadota bacterium]